MEGTSKSAGRPPLEEEKIESIKGFLKEGKTPAEIHDETGISLTKIYEIRRWVLSQGAA